MSDLLRINFAIDKATLDGLGRIALARELVIDRSHFKGEPNRSAALRALVAEELARMDAAGDPGGE